MRTLPVVLLPAVLLGACWGGSTPVAEGSAEQRLNPGVEASWQTNPVEDVVLSADSMLAVRTGPHTILWERDAVALLPPYTVEVTLRKRSGRLHEGSGLVFGGDALAGPEAQQHYSYFLVRGDGSYLIKMREGADTPIIRDWTADRAVRRDAQGVGELNRLRVVVGTEEVAFFINAQEVARVPASDLRTTGFVGLRVAHNVDLLIADFTVTPTAP